jgi:hypothetical protein
VRVRFMHWSRASRQRERRCRGSSLRRCGDEVKVMHGMSTQPKELCVRTAGTAGTSFWLEALT